MSETAEELQPGASRPFTVHAAEPYSPAGVRLVKGGRYAFEVPPGQTWHDASIACGPAGWTASEADMPFYLKASVKLMEWRRRFPEARWFEIIGAIGRSDERLFRIGAGVGEAAPYTAPAGGGLYAFPNDLLSRYGNNRGEMRVIVKRLA